MISFALPRPFLRSLLLAASLATALAPGRARAEAYDAAYTMVTQGPLANSLMTVATEYVRRMAGYANLERRIGDSQAQTLVQAELERLQPHYQDTWNQNLALAYTDFFSVEELNSLAKEGPYSRYVDKLKAERADVLQSVRARSTDLLRAFVLEALVAADAKASAR